MDLVGCYMEKNHHENQTTDQQSNVRMTMG